ncbi:hypothetical protein PR202_gb14340 [Eleusine coracana subsp. coracana]|uniref:(S)-2-hydroxy-acid oxidase n=1 Tax=Eleusine coracana subsp. coracana TaxID=191504 RepID=A0AAV5EV53_ELECO|nr:hypothetical protein PR202_gb14340 [Eleusine coracana subsp. coracana]
MALAPPLSPHPAPLPPRVPAPILSRHPSAAFLRACWRRLPPLMPMPPASHPSVAALHASRCRVPTRISASCTSQHPSVAALLRSRRAEASGGYSGRGESRARSQWQKKLGLQLGFTRAPCGLFICYPFLVYSFAAARARCVWSDALGRRRQEGARACGRVRPRVLMDVANIDMSASVLGYKISMPIMVAPTALHKLAHPEGELASARASAAAETIMIYKDRNLVQQLVRRAEKAGYKAIVLTVDAPRLGRREADVRNRFTLPPNVVLKSFEGIDLGNMDKTNPSGLAAYVASQVESALSWKIIKWLQSITQLPILVKGIITAEDTRVSMECGIAGIIVSNHGGRQLDYVPATISCLEEVVRETKGRVPVFLDSGIRRGTDVFKALALGASGVCIGRPLLYALAVDGEAGVSNALRMLRDELEIAMALNGCTSLKDITRNHVSTESDKVLSSRL